MFEFLDRRYALALYEIAKEQNKENEFIEDLQQISDIVTKNKEIQEILVNPKVGKPQKKELFDDMFKDKTFPEILSFIYVLIEKGRILELAGIARQMYLIHLEENNIVEGTVKSVIPLSDEEFTRLHEKLEKKYGKKIILEKVIDKEILGGLFVKVGNEVIDGTLAGKYEKIKNLMIHSK
ncbi:MAG: F0F1 ATP synthase subunit delta [Sarcina sp.]